MKKCPSSIQCRDSNSRLLEHESPPITTRPGLLSSVIIIIIVWQNVTSNWLTVFKNILSILKKTLRASLSRYFCVEIFKEVCDSQRRRRRAEEEVGIGSKKLDVELVVQITANRRNEVRMTESFHEGQKLHSDYSQSAATSD